MVPLDHPRVLVQLALASGAPLDEILAETGLTRSTLDQEGTRISYAEFETLERNALRLTRDPALGLRWGMAIFRAQSTLVGITVLGTATLGDAFALAQAYYAQVSPGWALSLRIEHGRGILTFQETVPRADLRTFATEAMLAGFYGLAGQALGRPLEIAEARFGYPRPAHHEAYRALLHDARCVWEQPVTEVVFDPAILREPVAARPTAAPPEAPHAQEAAEESAASRVRRVVLAHGSRRMTLAEVARELRTSARTLRRSLQQLGTSYQAISEQLLRTRAEEWVRSGTEKVEHIALELGFTDARSFRRAFKRWTGRNPNELRKG